MIKIVLLAKIILLSIILAFPAKGGELEDGITAYQAKEFSKAMEMLVPLANDGIAEAQFYVGMMYDFGKGTIQDDIRASGWYEKAAKQGHAGAQFGVARMWDQGEGIPGRMDLSWAWASLAAEQEISEAAKLQRDLEKLMTEQEMKGAIKEADRLRQAYLVPFRN